MIRQINNKSDVGDKKNEGINKIEPSSPCSRRIFCHQEDAHAQYHRKQILGGEDDEHSLLVHRPKDNVSKRLERDEKTIQKQEARDDHGYDSRTPTSFIGLNIHWGNLQVLRLVIDVIVHLNKDLVFILSIALLPQK